LVTNPVLFAFATVAIALFLLLCLFWHCSGIIFGVVVAGGGVLAGAGAAVVVVCAGAAVVVVCAGAAVVVVCAGKAVVIVRAGLCAVGAVVLVGVAGGLF